MLDLICGVQLIRRDLKWGEHNSDNSPTVSSCPWGKQHGQLVWFLQGHPGFRVVAYSSRLLPSDIRFSFLGVSDIAINSPTVSTSHIPDKYVRYDRALQRVGNA